MVFKKRIGTESSVDSHSSKTTNDRLGILFAEADFFGRKASNNITIPNITAYYNTLEMIWINVMHIVISNNIDEDNKRMDNALEEYDKTLSETLAFPTINNAKKLLRIVKLFHSLIIGGLHRLNYFVRISQNSKKGLKYVDALFGHKTEEEIDNEEETDL